jgi:hypothetical protein
MLTRIATGDLVVVKNVPDSDHFSMVRVSGRYEFEISAETSDQGHILPVEHLGAYHKNAGAVPSSMVRALNREQHPIRRTLKHKDTVIAVAELDSDEAAEPEPFKAKVDNWRSQLSSQMREFLWESLDHRNAERLVLEMLRNDGLNVEWTAGPDERGADLETEIIHGYGLSTSIAIQVKFHRGTEYQLRGLKQIEQAFKERSVDAGLLVTFADELSDDVEQYLREIRHRYRENVDILYGEELYARLLELIADSGHAVENL